MNPLRRLIGRGKPPVEEKAFPLPGDASELANLWQSGGSVRLSGSVSSSYANLYLSQLWVYVCVNKYCRGIARLPLKPYRRQGEERARLTAGPLADLMSEPYPGGSPFAFKEAIIGNLMLYGNALIVKVRESAGRPPFELWPVPWPNWEVVRGKETPVDFYIYHAADGSKYPFTPRDVIHLKWWGPGGRGDIIGPSPLEPLRRTLIMEDAAQRMITASFENGVRPGGVLKTDRTYDLNRPSDKLEIEALRENVERLHGGVDKGFRLAILQGGLDWVPMAHTFEEARVLEFRKLSREEAAAAYDIPAPVIGIVDEANFASIDMYHLMLYMDTLGPPTTLIEETFQVQLLNEPAFRDQFVEFDFNEVLKGDIASRMNAYRAADFMTYNEKRQRENLPPVADPRADMVWTALNTEALGVAEEDPNEVMIRANAAGALVRAGYDATQVLQAVGLPPITHTGLLPVTLQSEDAVEGEGAFSKTVELAAAAKNGNGNGRG